MGNTASYSRRGFLKSAGALTSSSLFRIGAPPLAAIAQAACSARDEAAAFATLGDAEARDFAAAIARLIPTTDSPGAGDTGVIWFWDNVLGDYYAHFLEPARGLRERLLAETDGRFADLDADAQDKALRSIEDDGRFEIWRVLTIFGFFAMAKYGGNKD
ncbi:MAG: gluconate 2-dehydrogenase subunit 3 family protein, partial [Woeseiaceae bacterium]|nr:gluconate 2-dehydrogenase subunit 3 family protein [Woeseiaceae bacterium]